jgi:hypothetical protein
VGVCCNPWDPLWILQLIAIPNCNKIKIKIRDDQQKTLHQLEMCVTFMHLS